MKGHENLKPNSERTPEELREQTRRAGIKSGQARRAKKQMRELAVEMLNAALAPEMAKKLNVFKVGKNDQTYNAAIVAKQIAKALQGDINAAKFLQDLAGQNSVQETRVEGAFSFQLNTMSREEVEARLRERERDNGAELDGL